jgi:hypothetical protein
MVLRIFRAVWFMSVMGVFVRLLFGYAGWQDELVIRETAGERLLISKEVLFYVAVGVIVIVNVVVYIFGKIYKNQEDLRIWIHSLVTAINLFFIVGISLIGVYNSYEKFDYSRIDFIIYGSVGLILLVALAWPLYAVYQKFFVRQAV